MKRLLYVSVLLVALGGLPTTAAAALQAVPVVSGLTLPVGMVPDPADRTVLYVVEQEGRIRVVKNGVLQATPFLDITADTIFAGDERGLLGLAFAPDYLASGRFFVHFNNNAGNTVVARFTRSASDPLIADPATRFDFEWFPGQRFIEQPFTNHKGGRLVFGPDGYLYLALGDGGSGGDPGNRAQNPMSLLGKILRIDVNVPDADPVGYRIPPTNPFTDDLPVPARDEVWALGLRNPWRFAFDNPLRGGTGGMLIGDVGQGAREEINYEPPNRGGRNYGWSLREGRQDFEPARPPAFLPLTEPIYDYPRDVGRSVTGGQVYRGRDLGPGFRGRYFYADYVTRRIFTLPILLDGGTGEPLPVDTTLVVEHTAELGGADVLGSISSIDLDVDGETYLVSHDKGIIFRLTADTDLDGLSDGWEAQFGLNPASSTGNDGATGDPDHDGQSNAQELQAGTHPFNDATLTRYFAEGSNSSFFDTEIALANPGADEATVMLRFQRHDGINISHFVSVPGQRRVTVLPRTIAGLAAADFATILETNRLVAADRTMRWTTGEWYGSHGETAVVAPASTWYLAEGATHGDFDLFYLIQNPNDTPVTVAVTYLRPAPRPSILKTYPVPPRTRRTIYVDTEGPELAATDVSAVVSSGAGEPIIVERAMYLTGSGQAFSAGHESAGVTATRNNWFFAEGATGDFFDMFLLFVNPGGVDATVTARYLLVDGTVITKTHPVAANSRETINVELVDPQLRSAAVSTIIESTQPIVAERSMFWPAGQWYEAHNSPGSTQTGQAWALAGGESGGPLEAQTFVLIANTAAADGDVRVTVLPETGAPASVTLPLRGNSRSNVNIATRPEFASVVNGRYGVLVEAASAGIDLVVERATYTNAAGQVWAAGVNSLATKVR